MNSRAIASLGFTLIGAFYLAGAVVRLEVPVSSLLSGATTGPGEFDLSTAIAVSLVPSYLSGLVGVALILLRNRLARALFKDGEPAVAGSGTTQRQTEVATVALSVLGAYFAVLGVSELFGRVIEEMFLDYGDAVELLWHSWTSAIVLALGLYLFLRSGRVANRWLYPSWQSK